MNDENIGPASSNEAICDSPVESAAARAPDDDCLGMESLCGRRDLGEWIPGGCDELCVHPGLSKEDRGLLQDGPLLCPGLVGHRLKP